ncbi:ATPase involved in chromosome partitioning [Pyrobaculum sp. WP30]|nr:ATPase involved in chromosome partitioning [Pyrobaculum sp. WP30]MDT7874930.1 ParA family protein [Pyrobaculum sp.]
MQVVAFLSASGGVGKTTIAAHLAHKFLSEGKKVLLIDLDPSAGLSTALLGEAGVAQLEEKRRTVGDALLKFLRGESVELVDYVTATKLGIYRVDLVPSGDSLSDAMGLAWFSGNRPSPERLLRLFLEKSGTSGWDVVILDTLPFYERRYTLTAFYAADKIIVVTHPYGAEPFRVKRMYNKLAEMVTTGIDIKARVLINRVDSRTTEGREAFKIVERSLNLPRFQTIISQRVAYSRVPAMGYLKEDDARKEVESLYREIKEWLNVELSLY